MLSGEQLSSVPLDAMEEVVVEPGASSASAAPDSDDSLSQPSSIALVESIDEALVPDIIAGNDVQDSHTDSCSDAPTVFHPLCAVLCCGTYWGSNLSLLPQ